MTGYLPTLGLTDTNSSAACWAAVVGSTSGLDNVALVRVNLGEGCVHIKEGF